MPELRCSMENCCGLRLQRGSVPLKIVIARFQLIPVSREQCPLIARRAAGLPRLEEGQRVEALVQLPLLGAGTRIQERFL